MGKEITLGYNMGELERMVIGNLILYKTSEEIIPNVFIVFDGKIEGKYSFVGQISDRKTLTRNYPCRRALPKDLKFDGDGRILFDDQKSNFIVYPTRNSSLEDFNIKRKLILEAGIYKL